MSDNACAITWCSIMLVVVFIAMLHEDSKSGQIVFGILDVVLAGMLVLSIINPTF